MLRDGGSYRDPLGSVYHHDGRVFRTLSTKALADYKIVDASASVTKSRMQGGLIDGRVLARNEWPEGADALVPAAFIEHPSLPCITYPYEWPFEALRAAALAHLDLHLTLLADDLTLADASAYNMQFLGSSTIFIDALSIRPYRLGEYWLGHDQFLRQFYNPLLLEAICGVSYAAFYRGEIEGLTSRDLAKILPVRSWLRPTVLADVILPARLGQKAVETSGGSAAMWAGRSRRPLPKSAFCNILSHLRRVIAGLRVVRLKTGWSGYAADNSYAAEGRRTKEAFVQEFVKKLRPRQLLDIGCNDGLYSRLSLAAGAESVIGVDTDRASLDRAFIEARGSGAQFLPLYADIANPSPSQGWRGQERRDLQSRLNADAMLALAVVHHLAIGRNVPLNEVIEYLIGFAPNGIIEFVPKSDPMVEIMLQGRDDIFSLYDLEQVRLHISRRSQIVREVTVPGSDRMLIQYQR